MFIWSYSCMKNTCIEKYINFACPVELHNKPLKLNLSGLRMTKRWENDGLPSLEDYDNTHTHTQYCCFNVL